MTFEEQRLAEQVIRRLAGLPVVDHTQTPSTHIRHLETYLDMWVDKHGDTAIECDDFEAELLTHYYDQFKELL